LSILSGGYSAIISEHANRVRSAELPKEPFTVQPRNRFFSELFNLQLQRHYAIDERKYTLMTQIKIMSLIDFTPL